MNNKIKTKNEIKKIVEELKKQGKKIVTTNGVFDILHIGHIRTFEEAKRQGDVLIVGLNSDSSVKKLKGPERPINNENDRAEVLAALEMMDYVVIFGEDNPINLLEIIKPDVHVKYEDYGKDMIEAETVKKYGGMIYLTKKIKGYSTTEMIKRLNE